MHDDVSRLVGLLAEGDRLVLATRPGATLDAEVVGLQGDTGVDLLIPGQALRDGDVVAARFHDGGLVWLAVAFVDDVRPSADSHQLVAATIGEAFAIDSERSSSRSPAQGRAWLSLADGEVVETAVLDASRTGISVKTPTSQLPVRTVVPVRLEGPRGEHAELRCAVVRLTEQRAGLVILPPDVVPAWLHAGTTSSV